MIPVLNTINFCHPPIFPRYPVKEPTLHWSSHTAERGKSWPREPQISNKGRFLHNLPYIFNCIRYIFSKGNLQPGNLCNWKKNMNKKHIRGSAWLCKQFHSSIFDDSTRVKAIPSGRVKAIPGVMHQEPASSHISYSAIPVACVQKGSEKNSSKPIRRMELVSLIPV